MAIKIDEPVVGAIMGIEDALDALHSIDDEDVYDQFVHDIATLEDILQSLEEYVDAGEQIEEGN